MSNIQFTAYLPKGLQQININNDTDESFLFNNTRKSIRHPVRTQSVTINDLPETKQQDQVSQPKADSEWSDIRSVIKKNEGFIETAKSLFNEPSLSIGYSFFNTLPDGTKITPGMTITRDEADKQLDVLLNRMSSQIKGYLNDYSLNVNPQQFNVLLDLGYHGGIGLVSKLLKEANGDSNKIGQLLSHYATTPKYGDSSITKSLQDRAARRVQGWNGSVSIKLGGIVKAQTGILLQSPTVYLEERKPEPYQKRFFFDTQEQRFQKWYNNIAALNNLSSNPYDPSHYYDWKGLFNEQNNNAELLKGHFPDTYKLPGHPTFSVESKYYKPGMIAGYWKGDDYYLTPDSEDLMTKRQQYAETRFKPNQVSNIGTIGDFQIVVPTWNDITKRYGLNFDINNSEHNKKVRDIYMQELSKYPSISKAKGLIKTALTYAAYNMGPGNLNKFLQKEIENGKDVYESWDWIDDLNPQTKNYVNFIVRGIDGPADLTNAAFKKALQNK